MSALLEELRNLFRLTRYGQTRAALQYYLWEYERARAALAEAFAAHDHALADVLAHEHPPTFDPPKFLLKEKPDGEGEGNVYDVRSDGRAYGV